MPLLYSGQNPDGTPVERDGFDQFVRFNTLVDDLLETLNRERPDHPRHGMKITALITCLDLVITQTEEPERWLEKAAKVHKRLAESLTRQRDQTGANENS
jgi:hypothetical protein